MTDELEQRHRELDYLAGQKRWIIEWRYHNKGVNVDKWKHYMGRNKDHPISQDQAESRAGIKATDSPHMRFQVRQEDVENDREER